MIGRNLYHTQVKRQSPQSPRTLLWHENELVCVFVIIWFLAICISIFPV
jgi:hypothetical protein